MTNFPDIPIRRGSVFRSLGFPAAFRLLAEAISTLSESLVYVTMLGIRCEDKNKWERRVALTPAHVADLVCACLALLLQCLLACLPRPASTCHTLAITWRTLSHWSTGKARH